MAADPSFTNAESARAFLAAYDEVLAQWPVDVSSVDVRTDHGTTHVQVCGPEDGPPVVLLHGGGATSTVWFANVPALAATHRVFAPDRIGDAGRSVRNGAALGSRADLLLWLDQLLEALGLEEVALCGHSYGGWIALEYALEAPKRVNRLVLLDPTDCFAGLRMSYRLRALPGLLRPGPARTRAFLDWETQGVGLDPAWRELMARGAEFKGSTLILPRRPSAERLGRLEVPTLVLLAEHSRAHAVDTVRRACRAVPVVECAVLPGVTHHSLPTQRPDALNQQLTRFLAPARGAAGSGAGREGLAAAFTHAGVAEAYQHRPPYPPEVFDTLEGLITDEPRVVLDLGAGEGALARTLAPRVDRVDALDISAAMVEAGRRRPDGGHPHLRWVVGAAESAELSGPYALVVAGASLHWMPWERTLARLGEAMTPHAFLAVVEHGPEGAPWQQELGRVIARHSRSVDYDPHFSVVDELEARGLWEVAGRATTLPMVVRQPVAAYLEYLHSTASLAREWMSAAETTQFDEAVRKVVEPYTVDGELELSVVAHLAWGRPTSSDESSTSP